MSRFGTALGALVTGALLATLASPSLAQSWPSKPVKFIVSLGPGSGADIGARLLADRLPARWGQPVVVENRPGGDAVVAINAFIGAKDDHTLLYTPTSSFTAHPYQHDKLPYDPRELSPVARISTTLVGFVVPASLDVKSVADFIAMIKAQPGKLNYTTATGMTDVIYEGYFKSNNLSITRVPYRDVVAPLTDLGEGRIQAYIGALAIEQPHIQAGRVKLIAVTNMARSPTQPETPTVTQARSRSSARSLPPSRRSSASRRGSSAACKTRDDLGRDRLRPEAARPLLVAHDPDAGLEPLDRQHTLFRKTVLQMKARSPHLGDAGLDHHVVAVASRDQEPGPRLHHGVAVEFIGLVERVLVHAERGLEQQHRGMVEHREVARIEHDPGRVAVAPLDTDGPAVAEHRVYLSGVVPAEREAREPGPIYHSAHAVRWVPARLTSFAVRDDRWLGRAGGI